MSATSSLANGPSITRSWNSMRKRSKSPPCRPRGSLLRGHSRTQLLYHRLLPRLRPIAQARDHRRLSRSVRSTQVHGLFRTRGLVSPCNNIINNHNNNNLNHRPRLSPSGNNTPDRGPYPSPLSQWHHLLRCANNTLALVRFPTLPRTARPHPLKRPVSSVTNHHHNSNTRHSPHHPHSHNNHNNNLNNNASNPQNHLPYHHPPPPHPRK